MTDTNTHSVIDIEALRQPITEDQPTGIDLRVDAQSMDAYYAVKDQRQTLRRQEREAAIDTSNDKERGQWSPVAEQCIHLLQTKSKDLELATWLVEALIRMHGFVGLRDGFILLQQMVEAYSSTLYPQADEEGISTTLAPLYVLNGDRSTGTLIAPIHLIPLLATDKNEEITTWHYQQLTAKKTTPQSDDALTLEKIYETCQQVGHDQLSQTKDELLGAIEAVAQLDATLNEHYGDAAPSFAEIKSALKSCAQVLDCLLKHLEKNNVSTAKSQAEVHETPAQTTEHQMQHQQLSADITDYATAVAQLQTVLSFFKTTQPHSILTFSLERIVRWSHSPLDEVLDEVIAEPRMRVEFSRATGVPCRLVAQEED